MIDNLDQSWDQTADLGALSQLLLGLLTTARKIGADVGKRVGTGGPEVTLSIFIRSDIYSRVAAAARELDKIPAQFLTWPESETLLQIIEERYVASRDGAATPEELWQRYFESRTRRVPTREYMASRVLPRPRDILYISNSAIDVAVRHCRSRVTQADVLEAERQYSQFAFEALLVEGRNDISGLEEILFDFAGGNEILRPGEVRDNVLRAGIVEEDKQDRVLDQLVALSFLGQETQVDQFEFAENPRDRRRLDALAWRVASKTALSCAS